MGGTPAHPWRRSRLEEMKAYVRRRLDTFINPLVYTFADGHAPHSPTIMTTSRALAE
jgi:hypothetical protein